MSKDIFEGREIGDEKSVSKVDGGELKSAKSKREILAGIKSSSLPIKRPTGDVKLEIVFVVDTTGSMRMFIEEAKRQIIRKLVDIEKRIVVRTAMIEYKDHGDSKVTTKHGFSNSGALRGVLNQLYVGGGDDTAEAVLDGLDDASELPFTAKERLIFLIGDAPAHSIATDNISDNYRDGCPCGLTLPIVAQKIKNIEAKFFAISLNNIASMSFDVIARACNGKVCTFESAYMAIESEIIPILENTTKLLLEQSTIRL